ncbi:MAG: DUF4838 domain-containing protein [Clostridia bacterium]|nr:DUF4838 domain-containing protein [Clostridia bacterium]
MKKIISVLLACVMCLSALTLAAGAEDAEEPPTVVVSANASAVESYAARTLQGYLARITGTDVPLVTDADASGENEIVVGATSRRAIDVSGLPDGGYRIISENGTVYIAGSGSRGNIYGVFGFLEKYCGCHWYAADEFVIPEGAVIVPDGVDYTYKPFFEYTETDWLSPRNTEYSLANGLNGNSYRWLSPEQGGNVCYISGFCHTLTTQFCAEGTYFAEHPEYYALVDGERQPTQLCLTNPDVLQIVTNEVLSLAASRYDPSQAVQIISLTQDDNQKYCTCDRCKALAAECGGAQSGVMLTFINNVARAVKAAGYDNIAIDTFAYQYTRKAPKNVVPDDNVIVRLCSIECCFGHALADPACAQNVDFMNDLSDWGKICSRIYVWDYATNYSQTLNPFADFEVLQKNMQTFYENGVKGMYVEGAYYVGAVNGEFADLRSYMISKFMQDPYCDYDEVVNGFLAAYYGGGWQSIREFIDLICDKCVTKTRHMGIYQAPQESLPAMTLKDISDADEMWLNAKENAGSEKALARVERSEICWRFWKANNNKGEFAFTKGFVKVLDAREQLYNDLVENGVTILGEGGNRALTTERQQYLLTPPREWDDERIGNVFVRWLAPLLLWMYQMCKDRA